MPKTFKTVQAVPCFVIVGVYEPETDVEISENHILVSSKNIAEEVCATLNADPEAYVMGLHGGAHKFITKFTFERFLVYPKAAKDIHTSYKSAMYLELAE